jgi:hypothetical protein
MNSDCVVGRHGHTLAPPRRRHAVTVTALVWPSVVSVTVQRDPTGRSGKARDTDPARWPAGTRMAMRPCWPAAGPAIVLVTLRMPVGTWGTSGVVSGVRWYTSITFTGTTSPAGTVTVWSLADTVAVTVAVAPSAVSVTVHTEPAGTGPKLCDTLPAAVPPRITNGDSASAVPLQTTWMVTGPWEPASGPAMVLVTSRKLVPETW